MSKRALCLSTYPIEDASFQQRIGLYLPYLRAHGWTVHVDSLIGSWLYKHKNSGGWRTVPKMLLFAVGLVRRFLLVCTARRYDVVWLHREAFPFFTPFVEMLLAVVARGRIVLDFDDALYSEAATDWQSVLRDPHRYDAVVGVSMASKPPSLPTTFGVAAKTRSKSRHVWIRGPARPLLDQQTTRQPRAGLARGVRRAIFISFHGALEALSGRMKFDVLAVGANNACDYLPKTIAIRFRAWSAHEEVALLQSMTVGLMH